MVVGQTITIVNQSGKVVKTSKTLVNVWKEAKSAYDERKAELKASRRVESESKDNERKARKRLEALKLDDDTQSRTSSRRSPRRGSEDGKSLVSVRRKAVPERPPIERGVTDSFYANEVRPHRPSPLRHDSHDSHRSLRDYQPRMGELVRRHTTELERVHSPPATPSRSVSMDDIDMDLAYGELPPPLPERKYTDEVELRSKMTNLQTLLDEFNCVQHSALATIDNLQKNPDAMAAVALTLAEISNLASKLAPGALMSMKGAFPAIIALLASPEFAIAAGVGVGVTIIAFGSYKIIKKIQARKEDKRMLEDGHAYGAIEAEPEAEAIEEPVEELRELSRIELWRRGVSESEMESPGTSVVGEFVTPQAARTLIEEGRLTEADFKKPDVDSKSSVSKKSEKKHKKKKGDSESGSKSSSRSKSKVGAKEKKKEPSGLRMLFRTHA